LSSDGRSDLGVEGFEGSEIGQLPAGGDDLEVMGSGPESKGDDSAAIGLAADEHRENPDA
jgi:hypothetical protein